MQQTTVRRRNRLVNRHGWWGIFFHASWVTLLAVLGAGVLFGGLDGIYGWWSAILAGLIVWVLSAVSVVVIAVVWQNHRDLAIPLAMGAFVVKIIVCAILLSVVPTPDWLVATPAALTALGAILVWQITEVLVFTRTREQIYHD
ncbi:MULTISPECIES: hypothetical protein [Auritidibacter]|uniref:hypothetical protein n=1 Tax=Auritidibacter TaxID=1160973 RepID=UPI000D727553|nr:MULTISPECIES: hypothetical protein [Auritidibacter]NIH71011.1 ATP synthase protein I [Auritidibacter ignavus]PXA77509.1 hypothetical protein DCC24_04175 [Auritidibacter sp. NML100628]PXA81985.1 hypothetical protein DCC25_00980 [Auritidibacter sp. NML120636]RMX24169.1 hypothetical protein DYI20_00950 [Auritidibacter ignavus]WGH81786.1 hypothetical protein QDX25_00975 [Auritidibacter ignavus]